MSKKFPVSHDLPQAVRPTGCEMAEDAQDSADRCLDSTLRQAMIVLR